MEEVKQQILTTQEACRFLRVSRPAFLKLICTHQIKAKKLGKEWKILKWELQTYLDR